MIAYLTKNLWSYEQVHPIPNRLPKGIKTFYITDNQKTAEEAKEKGWDHVYITKEYLNITDKLLRRSIIGTINCYPEKFADLSLFDRVYICDSNIITLPSNYEDFINHDTEKACYTYSGYYKGDADNILQELRRSVNSRWSYNSEGMEASTREYIDIMTDLGFDYKKESVSSAKYIGWNLKHKEKHIVADYVYNEYRKHLQGNIIFTIARVLYPDLVSDFRVLNDDVELSQHNFIA